MNKPNAQISKPIWLWCFILFGLLIVIQGALRKWIFPELSGPLYIAKDVVLTGAILLFLYRYGMQWPRVIKNSALPVLLLAFGAVVILQAFNVKAPSLVVGLLGIKSYLLYTSLLFIVPMALEYIETPLRFIKIISLFVILPVLILGIYQFFQPVDSWINQYVSNEMNIAGVLEHPRITGTFSYIGGMSSFLLISLFFGIGILFAALHSNKRSLFWLALSLLIVALIAAPMNGSRSVVLGFLIPLPLVLFAVFRYRQSALVGVLFLTGFLIVGYTLFQGNYLMEGWDTFKYRVENASDRDSRIQTILLDPVEKIKVGGITGYGSGVTHQGAEAISSAGRIKIPGVYYEGELGRVIIELGIIGALLFLAIKIWITIKAWKMLLRSRNSWELILSITAFCYLFLNVFVSTIVFNHISGSIYWLCAGCIIWVWNRQVISADQIQAGYSLK